MSARDETRRLRLSRETVRELDATDLERAAGGQATSICQSLIPTKCCTGYYPSINAPCDVQ